MAKPTEVNQDQNMCGNLGISNAPYISIPRFYAGRRVFITGGTGFLGKVHIFFIHFHLKVLIVTDFQVLVEKLLRSCPEIQNIYLLMRPKRGLEVSARLHELFNSPVSVNWISEVNSTHVAIQSCSHSGNVVLLTSKRQWISGIFSI